MSARPSSNPAPRPATSSEVERRIRVAFVEDDDDYRETVSAELADHGTPLHRLGACTAGRPHAASCCQC